MSTRVATIFVVVFGIFAIVNFSMRDGEVSTTSPLSIEEIIEEDRTERAVEAAYGRINDQWGIDIVEWFHGTIQKVGMRKQADLYFYICVQLRRD